MIDDELNIADNHLPKSHAINRHDSSPVINLIIYMTHFLSFHYHFLKIFSRSFLKQCLINALFYFCLGILR